MTAVDKEAFSLSLEPEPLRFPATHYVFIERRGSFAENAPEAWKELHARLPGIVEHNQVTGYLSLYRMEEEIYRAGVALAAPPQQLPVGLAYESFDGGKYRKFVLRGSYAHLAEATTQAVQMVRESAMRVRDDFNIENYILDPRITPADQLITEILFPVE